MNIVIFIRHLSLKLVMDHIIKINQIFLFLPWIFLKTVIYLNCRYYSLIWFKYT